MIVRGTTRRSIAAVSLTASRFLTVSRVRRLIVKTSWKYSYQTMSSQKVFYYMKKSGRQRRPTFSDLNRIPPFNIPNSINCNESQDNQIPTRKTKAITGSKGTHRTQYKAKTEAIVLQQLLLCWTKWWLGQQAWGSVLLFGYDINISRSRATLLGCTRKTDTSLCFSEEEVSEPPPCKQGTF